MRKIAASIIGKGVILLLWQLQCHCNPDHNKISSLFDTTVVKIFPNICLRRRSLCSNLAGIDPEKLRNLRNFGLESAAGTPEPLAYTTASSAEFCYPIFLYRVNCLKTIPFTAARTYIAHIWKYPLPLPSFRVKPHYFWRFFSGTSKFSKHPRIGSDVFEVWCTY